MNATEIPEQQRGLGSCSSCHNRGYCSWNIDGREYCETCADKKRGIVKELELPEASKVIEIIENDRKNKPFALQPTKTYNIQIGQLESGFILAIDGDNFVCKSKTDLINRIKGVLK